ncbi:MAG: SusC/RagA family TonB-linked outer membrane protein [Tannerella sp.]|jgi:TonB-linked SusC/RagA family outer membrane protein|nr:SusC/RagA family TonB-linked outer membrane protein [Tannerella sp.]
MKKNIIFLITALVFSVVIPEKSTAQNKNQAQTVTIASKVIDQAGQPVSNAEIFGDNAYARTDAEGNFTLKTSPKAKILVEAEGYEKMVLNGNEITESIILGASPLLYGDNDLVELPFRGVKAGDVVGAANGYSVRDISSYDNTIMLSGIMSGRGIGMLGGSNIRGLGVSLDVGAITGTNTGTAMIVVDGMPRDISSIRLSDIESITLLRDVNSAVLYGSAALNGVIMVKTKRGQAFKKTSNFTLNYGVAIPRETSIPEYLGSAEYMERFNKARTIEGLTPVYSETQINNFRTGNKYHYPDVDYYSSDYLKPMRNNFDLDAEFSGGNENARYYSNIGWNSSNSILNFGNGKNARTNNFNVRGNIDLKINDIISTAIDVTGLYYDSKGQTGSFWSQSATVRPFEFTPLIPLSMVKPGSNAEKMAQARKRDVDGKYLFGGTTAYPTSGINDVYAAGTSHLIWRVFSFNNRIDVDLSFITEGLSFKTNLSFDYYLAYLQRTPEGYSTYEPTEWDGDMITNFTQRGMDTSPASQNVEGRSFRRRMGFYGLFNYDRIFDNTHHFTGSLLGYGTTFKDNDGSYADFQGVKNAHLGLQLGYVYNRKYMMDFSSVLVNSVKLPTNTKIGFSPSVALAWVASNEEGFNAPDFLNHLKFKVSAGILKSDIAVGDYFYYDNRWTTSGSYNWNEGGRSRSGVISSWLQNPNLDFPERKEISAGFQTLLFNNTIGFEANYFYNVYDGLVVRPSIEYPSFYTDFVPYRNYEKDSYNGFEASLNINKRVGNWGFYAGINLLYSVSKRLKVSEYYADAYQYRKGYGKDATFGLEAIGFFKDEAEIAASPRQTYGTVLPGDIKYKDQNNDNVINAQDEVFLRRWQAPWSQGVELRVSYKDFTLFLIGNGEQGVKNFRESTYYWMDANDKYSVLARDSWTPETASTAKYPRISSVANSNNLRRSSFWLYSNDFFNLRRIQLNYSVPKYICNYMFMKGLDICLNATDAVRFAANMSERELRIGAEPYYTTYTVTLKAKF